MYYFWLNLNFKKTESLFAPKTTDKPKDEKPSLFAPKKEEPKVDKLSGFSFAPKTDKPKPSLVAAETPKVAETKKEEKPKEPEKKGYEI